MKNKIKISVVTPSFNQGRFLQKCIDGITKQRSSDDTQLCVEHIIVDNMSTDDTDKIVLNNMKYNDNDHYEIAYIREEDKGHHEAIAKGVKKATGDYITVCNTSDHYLDDRWFIDVCTCLKNDIRPDCIWGMTGVVTEENPDVLIEVGACKLIKIIANRLYGLNEYKRIRAGFTEVTAIFKASVLKKLMPLGGHNHPWLDLQFEFYKQSYMSVMFNRIATITTRHNDSMTNAHGGKGEEIKRFKELNAKIDGM